MDAFSNLDNILDEIDAYSSGGEEDLFEETSGTLPAITAQALIRETIAPEMSEEDINSMLEGALSAMSPDEIESFWKSLGKIAGTAGKTLVQAAPAILPVVGGAVGTAIAPGIGTALGTTLGRVAGQALGSATAKPVKPSAPSPSGGISNRPATGSPVPPGASSAVAQLLALIQNPAFLKSLIGQISGVKSSVAVGTSGRSAPFGSMMNALRELSEECAREANENHGNSESLPEYLFEETGEPVCDTSLPEERARALLTQLREGRLAEIARDSRVGEPGGDLEAFLALE